VKAPQRLSLEATAAWTSRAIDPGETHLRLGGLEARSARSSATVTYEAWPVGEV